MTARDHLTIRFEPDDVWETVSRFASLDREEARAVYSLGKDTRDWKVALAQADIRASGPRRANVVAVLYRPFDHRSTYYTGRTRGFICMPRHEVMHNMLQGDNVGLLTTRQTRDEWDAIATRTIVGHKSLSAYDITSIFPLYVYSDREELGKTSRAEVLEVSPWPVGRDGRRPNLNTEFALDIQRRLGLTFVPDGSGDLEVTFGPEDVFSYIYAVLHSPTYRGRYAEFLKTDFPRVPLTSDKRLFAALAEKGSELVALHLMESPLLTEALAAFPVSGTNQVEKVWYSEKDWRVWINKQQYFEGIKPHVWGFHVGGYQVCEKWLKDRKGRSLSFNDVAHYQKIVVSLQETIRLMAEIDAVIPGWPIE